MIKLYYYTKLIIYKKLLKKMKNKSSQVVYLDKLNQELEVLKSIIWEN